MSDTTSITDLPTDPTTGGTIGGNVSMDITENKVVNPSPPVGTTVQNQIALDPSTIKQLISGLQEAGSGATDLRSRDIPVSTTDITQDPQVKPNYIDPAPDNDYIKEYEDKDDIINKYANKQNMIDNAELFYDEIQTPLLITILFFLFQLPVVKKMFYSFFPILYSANGNMNLNGYLFISILFGVVYHILYKFTNYLHN